MYMKKKSSLGVLAGIAVTSVACVATALTTIALLNAKKEKEFEDSLFNEEDGCCGCCGCCSGDGCAEADTDFEEDTCGCSEGGCGGNCQCGNECSCGCDGEQEDPNSGYTKLNVKPFKEFNEEDCEEEVTEEADKEQE